MKDDVFWCRGAPPTQLPHSLPPFWQSTPGWSSTMCQEDITAAPYPLCDSVIPSALQQCLQNSDSLHVHVATLKRGAGTAKYSVHSLDFWCTQINLSNVSCQRCDGVKEGVCLRFHLFQQYKPQAIASGWLFEDFRQTEEKVLKQHPGGCVTQRKGNVLRDTACFRQLSFKCGKLCYCAFQNDWTRNRYVTIIYRYKLLKDSCQNVLNEKKRKKQVLKSWLEVTDGWYSKLKPPHWKSLHFIKTP